MTDAVDIAVKIVTGLVAVYAAGLSTYTFVTDRRDKGPRLHVRLSWGVLTGVPDQNIYALITVSNPGQRKVVVNSVGLTLKNKRTMIFPRLPGTASLPFECDLGASAIFWILPSMVAETLRNDGMSGEVLIRAYAREATGQEFYSRWAPFNTDRDWN